MEQEQTYQQVISKIENFNNQLATLENGDDTEQLLLGALSDIENHFKTLLEVIQQRKEFVICSVTQLFKQSQQENESEKNELKNKIEAATKILESGRFVYNIQRITSVMIWESAQKLSHTKLEQKTIEVNLPLIDSIHSYGTVDVKINKLNAGEQKNKINIIHSLPIYILSLLSSPFFSFSSPLPINDLDETKQSESSQQEIKTLKAVIQKQEEKITIAVSFELFICHQLFLSLCSLIFCLTITNKAFVEDTIDKSFTRRQESIAYFKEASEKLEVYESQNKALLQEIYKLKTKNQAFINRPSQLLLFKALVVSTLAGSTKGCANGNETMAQMNWPHGVVFNPVDDCLYVCDSYNHSIRKVTREGQVSTFVDINQPGNITFSVKQQCFFVSEQSSHSIKKVTMKGESSILAGGKGIGYQDGEGKNAMFNYPSGIAVNEETGDVYVADKGNNVIRMITSEGKVTTLAGTAGNGGYSDGKSKSSLFDNPKGICFHSQYQALFACDYYNNKLRRVSLNGQVSTVCEIIRPESVCILSNNAVLVSSCNNQIFKVSFGENNKVETKVFAGSGERGYKDGPPQESQFNWIHGMAIDPTTNTCFVSDSGNHKIRTIKYQ